MKADIPEEQQLVLDKAIKWLVRGRVDLMLIKARNRKVGRANMQYHSQIKPEEVR